MRKLFLPLTVVLFVVACGPRDVPLGKDGKGYNGKSNNGGGNSGQSDKTLAFVLDEEGERSETCPKDLTDYKFLLIPQEDVDQILTGTIRAVIEPGNRNCFRIGAAVQIKFTKEDKESLGEAVVLKTEALRLSALTKKQAEFFAMTVKDLKARGKELMDGVKFPHEGMVTITYFEVPGAASEDEDQDSSEDQTTKPTKPQTAATLLTFDNDGERPSTCNKKSKDWVDLIIPQDQDEAIQTGKVVGWIAAGSMNCLRVGSVVNLTDKKGGAPRGQLRVMMVQVFPVTKLNITHALTMNMAFLDLRKQVLEDLENQTFDHKDMVNMTFFEYVTPTESAGE